MKNVLTLILSLFFLYSCKTTSMGTYEIKEYPISFVDTIYYKYDHWHFCDLDNKWICVELEPDTVVIEFNDTLCFPVYVGLINNK